MKITELKSNPALLFICIFLFILVVGKIPIKEHLPYSDFASLKLEGILTRSILTCLLIIFISILEIPHSYFGLIERKNYIYYSPIIIYIVISTNGFNDFLRMSGLTLYSCKISLYGMAKLCGSLFEEILFRGFILGVLLYKYHDSKHGILKSVIISSLLFGLAHIANIWSQSYQMSTRIVINQVYGATCFGVMYSAIYLKTRSIIVLSILHFINNFFSGIEELADSGILLESVSRDRTIIEIIVSNLLTIIAFGFPFLIGLYILRRTNKEEVEKIMQ